MSRDRKVQLRSSDNIRFEVDLRVAQESQLLMEVVEGTEDYGIIFLPNVPSKILIKVIEYCTYHVQSQHSTDQNPALTDLTEDEIKQWDDAFVQVDHPTLVGLINAANYLIMNPLLDLMCRRAADLITGKSVEEIRRTFGIANNFTPELEAENRKRNEWVSVSTTPAGPGGIQGTE